MLRGRGITSKALIPIRFLYQKDKFHMKLLRLTETGKKNVWLGFWYNKIKIIKSGCTSGLQHFRSLGVNIINILRAHFAPIFWCKKLQSCLLGLTFFGVKISVKNACIKYWWNRHLVLKVLTSSRRAKQKENIVLTSFKLKLFTFWRAKKLMQTAR